MQFTPTKRPHMIAADDRKCNAAARHGFSALETLIFPARLIDYSIHSIVAKVN